MGGLWAVLAGTDATAGIPDTQVRCMQILQPLILQDFIVSP